MYTLIHMIEFTIAHTHTYLDAGSHIHSQITYVYYIRTHTHTYSDILEVRGGRLPGG